MVGAGQMNIARKGVLKTIRKSTFHFPTGLNGGVVVIEFYVCPAQGCACSNIATHLDIYCQPKRQSVSFD
jgi:hypothetical protein